MANINTTLKELKVKMDDAFSKNAEASRQEYIKSLPAGSPLPAENRIYSDDHLKAFRDEARQIYGNVCDVLRKEREKVSEAKTEAPTDEAVRAISLMKLMDVSADDVTNMLGKYGDNYSCYRAITSIAKDAGLKNDFGVHPYDKAADGIDYVASKAAAAFSPTAYEKEGVRTVSTIGFNSMVDNEFPAE